MLLIDHLPSLFKHAYKRISALQLDAREPSPHRGMRSMSPFKVQFEPLIARNISVATQPSELKRTDRLVKDLLDSSMDASCLSDSAPAKTVFRLSSLTCDSGDDSRLDTNLNVSLSIGRSLKDHIWTH